MYFKTIYQEDKILIKLKDKIYIKIGNNIFYSKLLDKWKDKSYIFSDALDNKILLTNQTKKEEVLQYIEVAKTVSNAQFISACFDNGIYVEGFSDALQYQYKQHKTQFRVKKLAVECDKVNDKCKYCTDLFKTKGGFKYGMDGCPLYQESLQNT